jgi:NAD+ synthase
LAIDGSGDVRARPAEMCKNFPLSVSVSELGKETGMREEQLQQQKRIIAELGVQAVIDAAGEVERRVDFLARYLADHQGRSYVLGISGGVDSATAGRLAQLAVERIRAQGGDATFIAVRLPHGAQADEQDAQRALAFICPDRTVTVDIKPASDAMLAALGSELDAGDPAERDFHFGNIKSRQRMVAQYALAGATGGVVVGTDHGGEAVMGFFTKYGDSGYDIAPLAHLNKRQVRALASALGAPGSTAQKQATADLEDLAPQKPDEEAFGVSYDDIDDFLEGKEISADAADKIITAYTRTMHKRMLPAAPPP